jgi:hypothetical protein
MHRPLQLAAYRAVIDSGKVTRTLSDPEPRGGQHAGVRPQVVTLRHVASGIVVSVTDERSVMRSTLKAWRLLRSRIAAGRRLEPAEVRVYDERDGVKDQQTGATYAYDAVLGDGSAVRAMIDRRAARTAEGKP